MDFPAWWDIVGAFAVVGAVWSPLVIIVAIGSVIGGNGSKEDWLALRISVAVFLASALFLFGLWLFS